MKTFSYKLALSVFLLSFFVNGATEIKIDIFGGSEQSEPVAILPFDTQVSTPMKHDIRKIVSDNLLRSGLFSLISVPQQSVSNLDSIGYKFYRRLNIENLLTGKIREEKDGRYQIKVALYDVLLRKKRWDYTWTFTSSQIRRTAHQVSDLVFKEIIGKASAFSSNLAFVTTGKNTKKRKVYRLKIADSDGYNAKTILKSAAPILSPAWSPDGKKLAYVSFENGRSEIFVHQIWRGQREVVAAFNGINSSPAWSPDGKSLLMTLSNQGNSELYLMRLLDKKLFRLTNHPAIDTEGLFSADAKHIFFTSDRVAGQPQIFRMNIDDIQTHPRVTSLAQVTKEGKYNAGASISQDGKYLALIHSENKKLGISLYDIENQDFYPITDTFLDDSPSLSPGANMIAYSAIDRQTRNGQLIIMNLRASSKARLKVLDGAVKDPAWGPIKKINTR